MSATSCRLDLDTAYPHSRRDRRSTAGVPLARWGSLTGPPTLARTDHDHGPADDHRRLDDGGVPPQGLGPREDRRLLLASRRDRSASGKPGGTRRFEPVACRSVDDFDVMLGHEIAPRSAGPATTGREAGADPAGRADGDVSLGGLLPQGVGRLVRPCPRLQHGRVERPRRQDPPRRPPGRVLQTRWKAAFYGPLGDADRPGRSPLVRHARPAAALRRADRRAEGERGRADRDLRDRPGLPHRLLGAPFRRPSSPTSTPGRPRPTASAPGCTR